MGKQQGSGGMNRDDVIRLAREACADIAASYASCEGVAQKIEQEIRARGEK